MIKKPPRGTDEDVLECWLAYDTPALLVTLLVGSLGCRQDAWPGQGFRSSTSALALNQVVDRVVAIDHRCAVLR